MAQVYLNLGSNTNRQQNIALALTRLKQLFGELQLSPVYESPAVDGHASDYYNLVAGFVTELPPALLKQRLTEIEAALGRQRDSSEVTIDLDLLLYGELYGQFGDLQLPHPDLLRYPHTLRPLLDLAGDIQVPGSTSRLSEIAEQPGFSDAALQRITE